MSEKRTQRLGRWRRARRIRGTGERPRLVVSRGARSIQAQLVDDDAGAVICGATSLSKALEQAKGSDKASAEVVGKEIARRAREKGITKVVFDRNGYVFHGRVKALADGAREGGLAF